MLLSKCAVRNNKKSRFMKQQEASRLLTQLGIRTRLSNIPILGDTFIWDYKKMNAIINNFLLDGDNFMPEMHLRQPEYRWKACRPLRKHVKDRIQKFKDTRDIRFICQNKLNKVYDIAYGVYNDLPRRTTSEKALRGKGFAVASNFAGMMDINKKPFQ